MFSLLHVRRRDDAAEPAVAFRATAQHGQNTIVCAEFRTENGA